MDVYFSTPAQDFLHPFPSRLAFGRSDGFSGHRIPKPINKVPGSGRCRTVGVEAGVRGCIGGGMRQGGGCSGVIKGRGVGQSSTPTQPTHLMKRGKSDVRMWWRGGTSRWLRKSPRSSHR